MSPCPLAGSLTAAAFWKRMALSLATSERCITLRNDFAALKGGDDARALHPPDPPAARRCLIPSDDALLGLSVRSPPPPASHSPSLGAVAYAGAQNRNAAVPTSVTLRCVCGAFFYRSPRAGSS